MDYELIKKFIGQAPWADVATAIAAFAAIVAAASAFLSYRLSKSIYQKIKSDEVVIAGPLHHPGLRIQDHDDCVLRCTLFNKSKRKTYISSVKAFDKNRKSIEVTWSDSMDDLGNIQHATGLLGLEDSLNLVLRRNDGKPFSMTTVRIKHSFRHDDLEISYIPYPDQPGAISAAHCAVFLPGHTMPDYRRTWHLGGTYFFTVNTLRRRGCTLLTQHIDSLRTSERSLDEAQRNPG